MVSAVLLLGLTVSFLQDSLTGVGWAYLISQVIGASLMAPGVWSRLRAIRNSPEPLQLARRTPMRLQGAI